MRCLLRSCLLLALMICACVELELHADLDGPRVLASSLPRPRNVEVPTLPDIVVDFSEAIDPASVHVGLVAWEELGRCDLSPLCAAENSRCERGRCMRDPLSAAAIKDLIDGPLADGIPLTTMIVPDSPVGPGTRLRVAPRRALQPHARHSLLVFVRDRSGAPLVDEHGDAGVWRRDLVTADEGSGGPEARLLAPPSGSEAVAPNLTQITTQFAGPVVLDPAATLTLDAEDGTRLTLVDPAPCPGWVPGLCLRWRPGGPVVSDMAYRPGGGSLRDPLGRAAVPPAASTWFRTAGAPDLSAPSLDPIDARWLGPCWYASLGADEPLQLQLQIGAAIDVALAGPGPVTLALHRDQIALPAGAITATLRAEDLAGNLGERALAAVLEDSFAPPLGLAEVLANPRGPEPAQEFVELVDLRADGEPQTWTDLHLADLAAPDVLLALAAGETPGDALPPFTTRPGERVLVVASGYRPDEGSDPAPAPGTALVRVDASLGAGGLKNAGEPMTLYAAPPGEPAVLVASYGNHITTAAPAHAGRSVVADPHACDLARAWSSHPGGSTSPGAAP